MAPIRAHLFPQWYWWLCNQVWSQSSLLVVFILTVSFAREADRLCPMTYSADPRLQYTASLLVLLSNFSWHGGYENSGFGWLFSLIDLLTLQGVRDRWWEAFKLFLIVVVSLAIGLLPYIDNFAHMGGFVFGLVRYVYVHKILFHHKKKHCPPPACFYPQNTAVGAFLRRGSLISGGRGPRSAYWPCSL
jgi:hypothetical protein